MRLLSEYDTVPPMKQNPIPKNIPPVAKKDPKTNTLHGVTWTDEYAWMHHRSTSIFEQSSTTDKNWSQQKGSPEVVEYAKAENAYAEAVMASHKRLADKLYKEMKSRMKETDMSVPVKDGPYLYYSRTKKGQQYGIHCRKRIKEGKAKTRGARSPDALPRKAFREEVLLDENILAKDQPYFDLGLYEVSPDHQLLAYAVDTTGNENHTLFVKDLRTGKLLSEKIEQVSDVEWAADSQHFFYTVEEHPHPPRKVLCHKLGSTEPDTVVYEEPDEQWYVFLSKSNDEKIIFVGAANFDSSEVRFVSAQTPKAPLALIAPRKSKVKYWPEHFENDLYIVTNENAVEYKIMKAPLSNPQSQTEWMPHNPKRTINGFEPYQNFFVIPIREKGSEQVLISNKDRKSERVLKLPEAEHSVSVWGLEYVSPVIRYTYDSFVTPKTVCEYDVKKRTTKILKKQQVPQWNPKKYVSKRLWAVSDGVKIPIVIVHKKQVKYNGKAPMMLTAYGSYGICSDPTFSITRIPLLERGWIVGIAQPRGGGEMGYGWHEDAKLRTKHRTYDDVIAACDFLVKKKVCAREKLVLVGGSAGGMMVGAVLNKRPDVVGVGMAYVPAADTLNSMLDESLGGTRLHYDEIGNPGSSKEDFEYIMKTSPYENVRAAHYPKLLVRASASDIRTPFWEAAKWVARLRAKKTDSNVLLFKTELSAGHFGKSGRYEYLKERGWDYAFLMGDE
ncbi:S9 family peptidase [bacterium]|nr:S9 family peptidase [bacterium]